MNRFEHLLIILFLSLSVYQISTNIRVEEIEEPKASLNFQAFQSCEMHGGVSCSKGKDSDGSAICSDGYAAVSQRYEENCLNGYPSVSIVSISHKLYDGSYNVMLRNNSFDRSHKISLGFKNASGKFLKLSGSENLSPLGTAVYVIPATAVTAEKPNFSMIDLKLNGTTIVR